MRPTSRQGSCFHNVINEDGCDSKEEHIRFVERRILQAFGVVVGLFDITMMHGPSAEHATSLLNHFKKCNTILNSNPAIESSVQLESETYALLRNIFNDSSEVEIRRLTADIFRLMTHVSIRYSDDYTFHARDLIYALKNEVAKKLQAHVRGFQTRLKIKQKEYEMRMLKGSTGQIYYFSNNNIPFRMPAQIIRNGPKGSLKQVIAQDDKFIMLRRYTSHEDEFLPRMASNSIEKLLLELNIHSYHVHHRVSSQDYIARNAGTMTLRNYDQRLMPTDFLEFLKDTKELHKKGYAHGDLHMGNLMVQERSGKRPRVIAIDLDDFCRITLEEIRKQERNIIDYILKLYGINHIGTKFTSQGRFFYYNALILSEFTDTYIKPEFKNKFMEIVQKNYSAIDDTIFLFDMFLEETP